MVQVFASKRVRYGRQEYAPGEPLEVSEKDAKVLIAVKSVTAAPEGSPTDLPKPAAHDSLIAPEHIEPPSDEEDEALKAKFAEEAAPEATVDPRTDTRDAKPTGRTGQVKPSRSSRQAHRQKGKR